MPVEQIIAATAKPAFYTRVAFLALRAAQAISSEAEDTPNHEHRVYYAGVIFRGDDKVLNLAMHIVSATQSISAALEAGTEVSDTDIETALASIWDARANAFAPPPSKAAVAVPTEYQEPIGGYPPPIFDDPVKEAEWKAAQELAAQHAAEKEATGALPTETGA